jgi:hypothetical protein
MVDALLGTFLILVLAAVPVMIIGYLIWGDRTKT